MRQVNFKAYKLGTESSSKARLRLQVQVPDGEGLRKNHFPQY